MKTPHLLFLFFLSLSLYLAGCKKDSKNSTATPSETPVKPEPITGHIELPSGSAISLNTLKVLSPIAETNVSQSTYNIDAFTQAYNTTMLTNTEGKVLMMGYNIPGQTTTTISVKSTALALLMNTPIALSLSQTGKEALIKKVQEDAELVNLEMEVRLSVEAGMDLFDTTNTALVNELKNALINAGSFKTMVTEPPILFNQNGRDLKFYNDGKLFTTAVGIYKDQILIEDFLVEGVKAYPNSISDILSGGGWGTGTQLVKEFRMEGDGDFELKMRTGLIGYDDGSDEYDKALFANCKQIAIYILEPFLPNLKLGGNKDCIYQLTLDIYDYVNTIPNINGASGVQLASRAAMDFVENITSCLKQELPHLPFFSNMSRYYKFIEKRLSVFGNAANISALTAQWIYYDEAFDTCYSVMANNIDECIVCPATVADIDGHVYPVVKIGNQCWMGENLGTKRYNNGGSIGIFTDGIEWAAATSGKYFDYDEHFYDENFQGVFDGVQGLLYNWYAVNTGNLCPNGWHIPSESEWETLSTHLGGWPLAGGKMKVTNLWEPPNTGATNSCDFSAFPAGIFQGILPNEGDYPGRIAGFWSNSSKNSSEAFSVLLEYDHKYLNPLIWDKYFGYSCRCIKD